MHEKVLSTSTLEKEKKNIQHPNKYDSTESVSKNKSVLLRALRVLLCHSDLTAPVSVKPTAHTYYSSVIAQECLSLPAASFLTVFVPECVFFPSNLSFSVHSSALVSSYLSTAFKAGGNFTSYASVAVIKIK